MKHAFDRFIHYLQTLYFSYWIVLGIDTFIALLCTWVSFIGIHYITETSKEIVSLFHILAVSVAVMSIETYEELTSRFELYSQIKEGMDDIATGNTRPFSEAMADIRSRRSR